MPMDPPYPVSSAAVNSVDTPLSQLPSDGFLVSIKKTWTHVPVTPEEAIALYRYTMKSQIEPVIAGLLKECTANLTEPEQAHVAANVKETVPLVKKGCC